MGQKVSPRGLRIGINQGWDTTWFCDNKKDYAKFLSNDIKIREYLENKLSDASISSIVIKRNAELVDVAIRTSKPGVIIGRAGEEIEKLKKHLEKMTGEKITINIVEVKQPSLDAKLVAEEIASKIEGRAPFRVAQKQSIRNTMKSGAKGIKTLVSGRLNGVEMARSEGYTEGTIPLHTLRADIDYATAEADTQYGKIGVKVWIYKGEILSSKKKKGGNQ